MAGTNPLGPPFRCDEPGCTVACHRRADLKRHKRLTHYGQKIFCPFAGCKHKGVKRPYRYRKHLQDKHPDKWQTPLEVPAEICWDEATSWPPTLPTQRLSIATQASAWNNFSAVESPDSTSLLEYQSFDQASNLHVAQGYPSPDLTTTNTASNSASDTQPFLANIDQQGLRLEDYGAPVVSFYNGSPSSVSDDVFYTLEDFMMYSDVFQSVYTSRTGTN